MEKWPFLTNKQFLSRTQGGFMLFLLDLPITISIQPSEQKLMMQLFGK